MTKKAITSVLFLLMLLLSLQLELLRESKRRAVLPDTKIARRVLLTPPTASA